jgi:hypothetical protein
MAYAAPTPRSLTPLKAAGADAAWVGAYFRARWAASPIPARTSARWSVDEHSEMGES